MLPRTTLHTGHLARLLVVCGALLGLFAMHGLGDHGAAHGEQVAAGHAMTMTTPSDAAVLDHAVTTATSAVTGMSDMGDMGMCVAVLTLLLLLVGLSPTTGLLRRWSLLRASVLAPVVRGRPPPCLTLLSIQRC